MLKAMQHNEVWYIDGDGYPDYNIDEDGSGIPTKNLITITEWKPEVKGDREGIGFGTMDVNEKDNIFKISCPSSVGIMLIFAFISPFVSMLSFAIPSPSASTLITAFTLSITISETTGTYRVCVTPTDNAGNTNTESCHEAELKKIDVDVDDDGKPDFNDPDGDGCPDLNIKWKDPNDETKSIFKSGMPS